MQCTQRGMRCGLQNKLLKITIRLYPKPTGFLRRQIMKRREQKVQSNNLQFTIDNLHPKKGFSSLFIIIIVVILVLGFVAAYAVSNLKYGPGENPSPQVYEDRQVRALQFLSDSDEVRLEERRVGKE